VGAEHAQVFASWNARGGRVYLSWPPPFFYLLICCTCLPQLLWYNLNKKIFGRKQFVFFTIGTKHFVDTQIAALGMLLKI
jgi:hypothetical protein